MINMDKGRDKQRKIIMAIGAAVFVLSIGVLLIPTSDEADRAPRAAKTMPPAQGFAAIFRHIRADKVCYEESRGVYFVRFPSDEDLGDWKNSWHVIKDPVFQPIPANGTWYLEQIPTRAYTQIWPDVSKLQCAEAPKE